MFLRWSRRRVGDNSLGHHMLGHWCCEDASRCRRHVFDPQDGRCIGNGRCGRHILDLRRFDVSWGRYVEGLLHDALGDALSLRPGVSAGTLGSGLLVGHTPHQRV